MGSIGIGYKNFFSLQSWLAILLPAAVVSIYPPPLCVRRI
jgi:hypothetical protein